MFHWTESNLSSLSISWSKLNELQWFFSTWTHFEYWSFESLIINRSIIFRDVQCKVILCENISDSDVLLRIFGSRLKAPKNRIQIRNQHVHIDFLWKFHPIKRIHQSKCIFDIDSAQRTYQSRISSSKLHAVSKKFTRSVSPLFHNRRLP